MRGLKHIFFLLFISSFLPVSAQTWIWFPGDYENWLGNQMNNRRTERGVMIPVQWKLDDFWDEEKKAIIFNRKNGVNSEQVTRHANMFAIFYDYISKERKEAIKYSVLLNPEVPAISTPYMRFYELEALCTLGEQEYVLQEIKDCWGGMLGLGATTFWEKYNPEHEGLEHFAMYGRPFGKSLCHTWGASPIYLLGKYFAGVRPLKPGYQEFEIKPVLGGLEWFDASIPTPNGDEIIIKYSAL